MPVLNFLTKQEIESKFFSPKTHLVIEYLLKKVLFSQPELLPEEKESNIQITKEFLESWIAQGIGLTKKGAGNYPIDAYSKSKGYAVDVKFMSIKKAKNDKFVATTNESSILQNFKGGGADLDQDFANGRHVKILSNWQKLLTDKLGRVYTDLSIKDIYYFIFVRAENTINLSICKLDFDFISKLAVDYERTTLDSVFVDNFIETGLGNVKIYKAKKRMELRLNYNNLLTQNMFYTWDFSKIYLPKKHNLLDSVKNEAEFKRYIQEQFASLFL
jgi:hypothetical protein